MILAGCCSLTKSALATITFVLYCRQVRITYYTTPSGRRPVEDFIRAQPVRLGAALFEALDQIEEHGLSAPGVSLRQIRGKLWEIRISAGGAARVFYCLLPGGGEETLVLLHAYLKKTQKAPRQEIETAEGRMREVFP